MIRSRHKLKGGRWSYKFHVFFFLFFFFFFFNTGITIFIAGVHWTCRRGIPRQRAPRYTVPDIRQWSLGDLLPDQLPPRRYTVVEAIPDPQATAREAPLLTLETSRPASITVNPPTGTLVAA